jgi:hypothetical protein
MPEQPRLRSQSGAQPSARPINYQFPAYGTTFVAGSL